MIELAIIAFTAAFYGFFWWLAKKNPKGDFEERHWESDR